MRSRPSWGRPANRCWLVFIAAGLLIALAACEAGGASTPVPTQTLIPFTATPIPPTPTPTPTRIAVTGISPLSLLDDAPPEIDALTDADQRRIARLVFEDLRDEQGAPVDDLRLLLLESARWTSERTLGCSTTSGTARIPGYRLIFVVETTLYTYHTDDADTIRLCERTPVSEARGDLLALVDPIAADMIALVRRRIATEQALDLTAVTLADAISLTWPNASLGCPEPGQTYAPIPEAGYRIIITTEAAEYAFHADFERAIQCAPEDAILPPTPDA